MRETKLYSRIVDDINKGVLSNEFRVGDVLYLAKSRSFLSKHSVGNGVYSEYFIRISRGLYKLK